MSPDGLWSIGELAGRAGVTVKTVRFYSERGLLPEAGRSSGGHRRYGAEALERLRLIRSLRGLDLSLSEVERVLPGTAGVRAEAGVREEARVRAEAGVRAEALEEVVAAELRRVEARLAALRWREASLRLVRDGTAAERVERLRLIGAVAVPPDTDAMARFWRRILPVRLPGRVVSLVVDAVVPRPPREPDPEQVLAFARLHELVTDPRLAGAEFRPAPPLPDGEYRPAVLYEGLAEAYALAAAEAEVGAGRGAEGGGALDCFVSAYAVARGEPDGAAFRRRLVGWLAVHDGPVIGRYWKLAAGLFAPGEPVLGVLHHQLSVALRGQVRAGAG
ncbi:MerR family transcriptional regulator [Streptomyces sp. NPDC093089]|uniref:MerR family transcriptional regulator n=1 Tax=Streptomyces sp. NPDC093089 TaxID=3366024 RepID=UPI00380D63A6